MGKEDVEKVWKERILPVLDNATSVSFVERNFLKQHIEASNDGPSVMIERILDVKSIKQLDVYAEYPGKPFEYSEQEIRNEVNKLIKRVNKVFYIQALYAWPEKCTSFSTIVQY